MLAPIVGTASTRVGSYALYCTECELSFLHTDEAGQDVKCPKCLATAPVRAVMRRPPVMPTMAFKPAPKPRETEYQGIPLIEGYAHPYGMELHLKGGLMGYISTSGKHTKQSIKRTLNKLLTYESKPTCIVLGCKAFDLLVEA